MGTGQELSVGPSRVSGWILRDPLCVLAGCWWGAAHTHPHESPLAALGWGWDTDRWKAQLSLPALLQIFGDYYHFWHRAVTKRSLSPHRPRHSRLQREPQVSVATALPATHLPLLLLSGAPLASSQCPHPLLPSVSSQVQWLEQQVAKRRSKRDVYQEPTDPKFPQQWYLVCCTSLHPVSPQGRRRPTLRPGPGHCLFGTKP